MATVNWTFFLFLVGLLIVNNVNGAMEFRSLKHKTRQHGMKWSDLLKIPLKDLMQMKAGDDECKDEHEECKSNSDLCSKDTYSVMMVYLCPLTCSFCEARKHFPDSGLSCTDHTPRCIKKSHKDKCETDEEIKKSCPWTCKTCSNDQTETAKA